MQTQVKPQTFFSEQQTLELKILLGTIVVTEDYFLSVKKYLLDKDKLTFDEALTVLTTLQHSHYRGTVYPRLDDIAAFRLREAIRMLTDVFHKKYLLPR